MATGQQATKLHACLTFRWTRKNRHEVRSQTTVVLVVPLRGLPFVVGLQLP